MGDRAWNIAYGVVDDAIDDIDRIVMRCLPACLEAAALIDGDVDDNGTVVHGVEHLPVDHDGRLVSGHEDRPHDQIGRSNGVSDG